MGESHVDHLIGHLITESTNPTVGVLAHSRPGGCANRRQGPRPGGGSRADRPGGGAGPQTSGAPCLRRRPGVHGGLGGRAVEAGRPANRRLRGYYRRHGGGEISDGRSGPPSRRGHSRRSRFRPAASGGGGRRLVGVGPGAPDPGVGKGTSDGLPRRLGPGRARDSGPRGPKPESGERKSFFCVTDGRTTETRSFGMAGRGRPDRTRTSLYALDLVRMSLLGGMGREA